MPWQFNPFITPQKEFGVKKVILFLVTSVIICFANLGQAKEKFYVPNDEDIAIVDNLYKEKNYAQAFPMYEKLAESGDKHSQYKLSIMYLLGLGTEKDFQTAYAWAKLSKSTKNEYFVEYFDKLDQKVEAEQREKIENKALDLYLEYNDLAVSERYLKHLKEDFPKCTGSRLRSVHACNKITVMCGGWIGSNGSLQYLSAEKECKEFVAKISPENLRAMKKAINTLEYKVKTLKMRRGIVTVKESE